MAVRTCFLALAALLSWSLPAPASAAPESPTFTALEEVQPGTRPLSIGLEADLAQVPTWTDLEARTRRLADVTVGSFQGAADKKIHYRLYRHRAETRGAIVIVSGRTEGLALYQETILDLVRNGYSVYIHDHRGQGFSERLVASDPTLGYIDEFSRYVEDLAAFIEGPVRAAREGNDRPLFLLAHSMGGTIAALYMERQPVVEIEALALVTPMMEPWAAGGENAGIAAKLADVFCDNMAGNIGVVPGLSTRYAQGGPFDKQYEEFRAAGPNAPNGASHSRVRWERNWETRRLAACEGPSCGTTHARVGGASFRWLNQSCSASQQARGAAAARIAVPVLLLQGEKDPKVKPSAQAEFCRNVGGDKGPGYCIGRTIIGAEHAVLMESDDIRVPAMSRILNFFNCAAVVKERAVQGRCR